MSQFLTILSQIVGWTYFLAWSISFYPQVFLNYRLKHVQGYSFNFGVLNWTGFLCYSIYSIWGFSQPGIMPGTVDISDIAFAVHAFILMTITLIQCQYYDSLWTRTDLWVKIVTAVFWTVGIVCASIQLAGDMPQSHEWNGCLCLGYIKVLVTIMKYMPQVYRNWSRQSTVGWSIWNILLDFTGGFLSIVQIFIDGANTGNWNVFGDGGSFNIAKFMLGICSVIFDIIFMIQHYILYNPKRQNISSDDKSLDLIQMEDKPDLPSLMNPQPWYSGGPLIKKSSKLKTHKKVSINTWYKKGVRVGKTPVKFQKGACTNCGAKTHTAKTCCERPRKIGAKYTGKNLQADEVLEEIQLDYDGKHDRWNGFQPQMYDEFIQNYSGQSADKQNQQRNLEYSHNLMQNNIDPRTKTITRNNRMREDTASYLTQQTRKFVPEENLTPKITGDQISMVEVESFIQKVNAQGNDLHPLANPLQTEKLYKLYKEKQSEYQQKKALALIEKYGKQDEFQPDN